MKKPVIRTLSLGAAALLLAALLCVPALAAVVERSDSFYVADYAGVLSDTTEQNIIGYNGVLEKQCDGAQIVVVTINYLSDGLDSQQYALKLMNDWDVGSADENNGMLLLLVAKEYKGWLMQGYGIKGSFTDDIANEYLNEYFWDYVDADKFDEGVNSLFTQLLYWYQDHYNAPILSGSAKQDAADGSGGYDYSYDYNYDYSYDYGYDGGSRGGARSFSAIVTIIVILVVLSLIFGGRRRRYYGGGVYPFFIPFFFGSRFRRPPGPGPRPGPRPPSGGRWRGGGGGGFGGGGRGGGFGGFGGGGFGGGIGRGGGGFGGGGGGGRR